MFRYLALLAILASGSALSAAERAPRYADRWVYSMYNLQVEKSADEVVQLVDRAAKAGYTGVVLADYKLNILDRVPEGYFRNVARVKKAAEAANIELIPLVFPIGYSKGILVHDPNLAAGLPVKDAPFVTKDGRAVPASPPVRIENGDFEAATGDRLLKLGQDGPGKCTFVDRTVAASGKQSVRMQETTADCRITAVGGAAVGVLPTVGAGEDERLSGPRVQVPGARQERPPADVPLRSPQARAGLDRDGRGVQQPRRFGRRGVPRGVGRAEGNRVAGRLADRRTKPRERAPARRLPAGREVRRRSTVYEEGKDFLPVKDAKLATNPTRASTGSTTPEPRSSWPRTRGSRAATPCS
jgi:hypothetical protein